MNKDKLCLNLTYINLIIFIFYSLFISFFSNESLPFHVTDFKNYNPFFNINFKFPYLLDKPLGEDAFYLILAASNFSEGKGLIGNFGEPITGIQPLIVFIYATIIKLLTGFGFQEIFFLRIITFFNSILIILFSFNLYKISSLFLSNENKKLNLILTLIFTLFSFHIYRMFLYGLETGLYLVFFSYFVYSFLKIKNLNKFSILDAFKLGLIIGLTGLARIDFGVFYLCILIFSLINFKIDNFKNLIFSGAIGFVIVFFWLYYVFSVSGNFIPSSGSAQSLLINSENYTSRIIEMISSVAQNLFSIVYIFGLNINNFLVTYFGINDTFLNKITVNLPTSRFYLSLFSIISFFLIISIGNKDKILLYIKEFKEVLFSIIILILIYLIFFWPEHFYKRYSSIFLLFSIPLIVIIFCELIKKIKFQSEVLLFLNTLIVLLFFIFSYQSYFSGRISNLQVITASNVDSNKFNKIGSFQSGVFGYVHRNVINLDGKANFEILSYIKNNNIDEYLRKNKDIDLIIDWPVYINKYISKNYLKNDWKLCINEEHMRAIGYCRIN
jgi:hypothetical protein